MFQMGSIKSASGTKTLKALDVGAASTFAGPITILDETDAVPEADKVSLQTAGGIVVSKSLFVKGKATVADAVRFDSLVDATSVSSGSLVVAGGVGIGKSLHVNGSSTFTSPVYVLSDNDSTSPTTGSLVTQGGMAVGKSLVAAGAVSVLNDADTISNTTGSIVTKGGIGVAKSLYVGGGSTFTGTVSIQNTLDASSAASGSVVVAGGLGLAKSFYVGGLSSMAGIVSITNTTDSSSSITGSLTTLGGIGVAKTLTVGGKLSVLSTTDSTSTTTGALVTVGGIGVAKALTVGGKLSLLSTTDSTSATTGALVASGGVGVGKSLYVGGKITVADTTDALDRAAGSLVTAGGMGVNKSLWVATSINVGTEAAANINSSYRIVACNTNLGANTKQSILLGAGLRTYDAACISHFNAASGSVANRLELGFFGEEDIVTILPNGRVGIGNTAPAAPLHVSGLVNLKIGAANATTGVLYNMGSTIKLNAFNVDIGLRVDNGIHVGAVGVYATSDRRKKENIQSLDFQEAIDFVKCIEPRTYNLKTRERTPQIGYIAQELQNSKFGHLLVSGVSYPNLRAESDNDTDNVLMIAQYERICCILHKALQNALSRIEALEGK